MCNIAKSKSAMGAMESPSPAQRLSEVLLEGLAVLAATGEPEKACRLAGRACVILRDSDPAAARRFDVLLHRLTAKLTW